jgi:hypothetical protein
MEMKGAHLYASRGNFTPNPAFAARAVGFQILKDFFDVQLLLGVE